MTTRSAVRRASTGLLSLAFLAALPAAASAQSAADIMREAMETFQDRVEGIENYTVVQRVMGQETTTYFERAEIDGIVVFEPVDADAAGPDAPAEAGMDPTFFFRPDVAERMTYEGTDQVEGNACHEVALSDFQGLGLDEMMPDPSQFRIERMTFCVDDDEDVVRRMVMTGSTSAMGEPREVTTSVVLQDYREVGGMLHPWRMEMTNSGIGDAMQGHQGAMADAMAQMEKQLEQMPEAQREQMREMMESRMEAMQQAAGVVAGEPIVVEVLDVRVNQGPPAGGR